MRNRKYPSGAPVRLAAVLFALSLSLTAAAWAVSIDWVTVGGPGNVADNTGFGSVGET